jgi:nucleolar GTP-binding protein
MNFQDLKKIENSDFYIDLAFRRATERADIIRSSLAGKPSNRLEKSKAIELEKIATIKQTFSEHFEKIVKNFPSLDDLPEFYKELIKTTLDYEKLKKSLGAVNSARLVLYDIYKTYNFKIKKCNDLNKINDYRREFYGRFSSLPKRIKKELEYPEYARKTMNTFPAIKTGIRTIAIAGFPNVGKSTLLSKITTSKPEINAYPFTTKGLNVGYLEQRYDKVQFVDTPGTLNRFEKMNYIEKAAHLAMKYAADKIIYIFDPTEEYSIEDQMLLLERTEKLEKPILIYISKTDVADKSIIDKLKLKYKDAITDANEIKKMKF